MMDKASVFIPQVHQAHMRTQGRGYFGKVSSAYLELEAYLIHAAFYFVDAEQVTCRLHIGSNVVRGQLLRDIVDTSVSDGSGIWCLPLQIESSSERTDHLRDMLLTSIVLEEIDGTDPSHFKRVGLLTISVLGQQLDALASFGIHVIEHDVFEVI